MLDNEQFRGVVKTLLEQFKRTTVLLEVMLKGELVSSQIPLFGKSVDMHVLFKKPDGWRMKRCVVGLMAVIA